MVERAEKKGAETAAESIDTPPGAVFQETKKKLLGQIRRLSLIEAFPADESVHRLPISAAEFIQCRPRLGVSMEGCLGEFIPAGGRETHRRLFLSVWQNPASLKQPKILKLKRLLREDFW
jgi:hypothetical protein